MSRFLLSFLILVLFVSVACVGVFVWGQAQYGSPGPLKVEKAVVIPKGTGIKAIAELLVRSGVIEDALIFRLGVRFDRYDTSLKAGEYLFPVSVSAREAAEILTKGKTIIRRLTIAEGLTSYDVVEQLSGTDGLVGVVGVPGEGELLPETYHFSYGDERSEVIRRMKRGMATTLSELWDARAVNLPLNTPEEAVILASIVEKETGVVAERARVAGVFINRLRKGMRLQSDPTVAYGLTNGLESLGRPLSRKDLRQSTPYNTYVIHGLPPGPICNPGIAALSAVLHPAETRDLYFVADGSGGHAFARTLKEHNRNVARWRKLSKK